ncbi:hypothetical protein ACKAV7_002552 [Fusarium commune]
MGKKKSKNNSTEAASSAPANALTTTSTIVADPILGYRIRVLHDFLNFTKDSRSQKRLNSTIDEHYISAPYFNEGQAASFETAVRTLLGSFLDKRRASGDARPCGPHHLAPLYAKFFGIDLEELKEDKFLGRLRRAGI